jgi:hypothetical protein
MMFKLFEPFEKAGELYEILRRIFTWVRTRAGVLAGGVAVVLLVLGLIWWEWPDIRERPGVEQAVGWLKYLETIPRCGGENFCVAVADL